MNILNFIFWNYSIALTFEDSEEQNKFIFCVHQLQIRHLETKRRKDARKLYSKPETRGSETTFCLKIQPWWLSKLRRYLKFKQSHTKGCSFDFPLGIHITIPFGEIIFNTFLQHSLSGCQRCPHETGQMCCFQAARVFFQNQKRLFFIVIS